MAIDFLTAYEMIANPYGVDRIDDLRAGTGFFLASGSNLVLQEDGIDLVLAKCLDPDRNLRASKIAATCLRANTQGAQTGAARLAIDPDLGLVLMEHLPISRMDEARLIDRVSAFLAYAEFWEMEGLPALIVGQNPSRGPDIGMIRV